jgi:hypothetical protein
MNCKMPAHWRKAVHPRKVSILIIVRGVRKFRLDGEIPGYVPLPLTFHKAAEVKSQQVTYSFDTLNLPYETSGG